MAIANNEIIFRSGLTEIHVEPEAHTMGYVSALFIADAMKKAAERGERPMLWLMAAPSGFAFYDAFVELVRNDNDLADICHQAAWFQFDDYPIPRDDPRFPITFRYLLENRFFDPLRKACGRLEDVFLLEIGSKDDQRICDEYAQLLIESAENPKNYLIQLKGIGMDGHWGFHSHEISLYAPPSIIRVDMNDANIHQQKIDWPQYFRETSDVPRYAFTCNVQLFMKARMIVDVVPQASKIYSVLAAYGNDMISNNIPSSLLKTHPNSYAFLTQDSAWALLKYREEISQNKFAKISHEVLHRLESIWKSDNRKIEEVNIRIMRSVLSELEML